MHRVRASGNFPHHRGRRYFVRSGVQHAAVQAELPEIGERAAYGDLLGEQAFLFVLGVHKPHSLREVALAERLRAHLRILGEEVLYVVALFAQLRAREGDLLFDVVKVVGLARIFVEVEELAGGGKDLRVVGRDIVNPRARGDEPRPRESGAYFRELFRRRKAAQRKIQVFVAPVVYGGAPLPDFQNFQPVDFAPHEEVCKAVFAPAVRGERKQKVDFRLVRKFYVSQPFCIDVGFDQVHKSFFIGSARNAGADFLRRASIPFMTMFIGCCSGRI